MSIWRVLNNTSVVACIVLVFFWGCADLLLDMKRGRSMFGLPVWAHALWQLAVFVIIARLIWRGR